MVFGADSADLSGNRRSSSSGLSSRHTPGAEVSILVGASRGTDAPILPSLRSLRVLGPAPSRAGAGAAREGKGQAEQVAPVGPSSSPAWLAGGLLSHPRAASPEGMKIPRSSHSGWFCQATSSGVWLLHTVGVAWAYGLLSCPWGSPQAPPGGDAGGPRQSMEHVPACPSRGAGGGNRVSKHISTYDSCACADILNHSPTSPNRPPGSH